MMVGGDVEVVVVVEVVEITGRVKRCLHGFCFVDKCICGGSGGRTGAFFDLGRDVDNGCAYREAGERR